MPDGEELREERLAEALLGTRRSWDPEEIRDIVGDLLPVVERYGRECAAEALREAAGHATRTTPGTAPVMVPVSDLYDRAVALDGAQDRHGRTETGT